MLEEYDVVELTEKLAPGLEIGTRGAVLMVYHSDPPQYEVEFVDDRGATIEVRAVQEHQVRKRPEPPPRRYRLAGQIGGPR